MRGSSQVANGSRVTKVLFSALSFVLAMVLIITMLTASPPLLKAEDTASAQPTPEKKKHIIYQRMGGSKVLNDIVNDFVKITADDPRINQFFAVTFADPVRLKTFKIRFVDQICELVRGPCHYLGKTMPDAHAGMKIKKKHFKAMIENLTLAMKKNGISKKDRKFLLKRLRPMRKEIVNAPPKPTPTMSAGGFR